MKFEIKYLEAFWEYLCETVESENLEYAVDEFDIDVDKIKNTHELSEDEAYTLMHDLVYMTLNEIYSGDFDTTYDALLDGCGMPPELADEFLDF